MNKIIEIAIENKDISLSINEESSKLPIIPPILNIIPFNALAVLLNSGTQTSEYMAKILPAHKDVKKNPRKPIAIKNIQEIIVCKDVSALKGIK